MIKLNTSKADRDPNIYLGIDGTGIPKNKINCNIYSEEGFYIFQEDLPNYGNTQLKYSKGFFYIITNDSNSYLTEEDLKISVKYMPSKEQIKFIFFRNLLK